jgi:GDPmannose 4,6-dehydratase
LLIGDATKAKEKLGWQPKYTLQEMVREMVDYDLELFKKQKLLLKAGFNVLPRHE